MAGLEIFGRAGWIIIEDLRWAIIYRVITQSVGLKSNWKRRSEYDQRLTWSYSDEDIITDGVDPQGNCRLRIQVSPIVVNVVFYFLLLLLFGLRRAINESKCPKCGRCA